MSEKTWKRNTAGMAAHAQSRKEQKRKGVQDAITALLREQKPINFHTVARAAAVSKAYLYSQLDLRERIEALRQQGVEQMVRQRVTRSNRQNGRKSRCGDPWQRSSHQSVRGGESPTQEAIAGCLGQSVRSALITNRLGALFVSSSRTSLSWKWLEVFYRLSWTSV